MIAESSAGGRAGTPSCSTHSPNSLRTIIVAALGDRVAWARDRGRFLRPDEIRRFFEALTEEPNEIMRDTILRALLAALRRGNVVAMK